MSRLARARAGWPRLESRAMTESRRALPAAQRRSRRRTRRHGVARTRTRATRRPRARGRVQFGSPRCATQSAVMPRARPRRARSPTASRRWRRRSRLPRSPPPRRRPPAAGVVRRARSRSPPPSPSLGFAVGAGLTTLSMHGASPGVAAEPRLRFRARRNRRPAVRCRLLRPAHGQALARRPRNRQRRRSPTLLSRVRAEGGRIAIVGRFPRRRSSIATASI